jgi:hypothetical protein
MNWIQFASLAGSVATVIAAIAVVVTVVIYHRQLRSMTKTRQHDSLLVIMRYADDLQLRRARYLMLEHRDELAPLLTTKYTWQTRNALDQKIRELSSNELSLHHVDLSLNALNNICFLIRNDYAPPDAMAFMRNTLLHAWPALEAYIEFRRTRTLSEIAEPSRYAEDFKWLAGRARDLTVQH